MGEESKVVVLPESPEKKRRKLLIIISVSIVVLSLVAVLILSFSPLLAAKKIEVSGTKLTDAKKLTQSLEPLKGTPLPRISESKVQELIGEQPAIDSVVVKAQMPNTLVVEVIEADPVAILVDGDKQYLVSETGKKLRTLGKKDKTKLPKIKASNETKDPEKFKLLTSILSSVDQEVLKEVTTATLSKAGFAELALPKKRTLIWGDNSKSALKNQVAKIFVKELGDKDSAKTTIDVTNPENPVVY